MAVKRSNGNGAVDESALAAFLTVPGFQLTTRFALEAARFSALRMRAYADQMEALAKCQNASDLIAAQQAFVARLQQDYAAEGEAMQQLIAQQGKEGPAVGA